MAHLVGEEPTMEASEASRVYCVTVPNMAAAARYHLSMREVEILYLSAQGLSGKQMAERMGTATDTVRNQMTHVLLKLRVRNRSEAVYRALCRGILAFPRGAA